MECHEMSCFVMGPVCAPVVCAGPTVVRKALRRPFRASSRTPPLPEERSSPAHNARAHYARRRACAPARARRWGRALRPVGVGGRLRSFVPPRSGPGAGRGVPVSRVSCAGACAGGRAYRGGAVRARDCPHARGPGRGRTPPVRSRRGVCGAPAIAFCRKRKGSPGSRLSLMPILHHSAESQTIPGTKNENIGQLSHSPLNRRDNLRRWIRRSAAARNEQRTGTSPPVSGLDFADRALVPDSAGSEGSRRIGTRIGAHGRFSNGLRDGRRRAVLPRPVRRSASGNGPGGGCGGRTARPYSSCRRRVSTPRRASGRARSCPPAPRCGASGRPPVPRAG